MMLSKKAKLRKDLPPIDIRKKTVKGFLGSKKMVPMTKKEQKKVKAELMKKYPDRYYLDDLNEWNSVDEEDCLLDHPEIFEAFMDD